MSKISPVCLLAVLSATAVTQLGVTANPRGGAYPEIVHQANASPPQAAAQFKGTVIPDKFVNLQALPKDIPKPELVELMKQFSITFKVRCSYCHAVSDDLTQGNFDSDEKPTKQDARKFIATLMTIATKRVPK